MSSYDLLRIWIGGRAHEILMGTLKNKFLYNQQLSSLVFLIQNI